jgi:hypothetical protein
VPSGIELASLRRRAAAALINVLVAILAVLAGIVVVVDKPSPA